MKAIVTVSAAVLFALATTAGAWAEPAVDTTDRNTATDPATIDTTTTDATATESRDVGQSYRASSLIGIGVQNPEGENLGTINDLVIDMKSGKVRYVAVSFGGFLGIGDKLFAVPVSAIRLNHQDNNSYFVLDVPKERLENAPGFDQNAWPSFADKSWAEVDKYYSDHAADASGTRTHMGSVVSTANGQLTMTDERGEGQHSHNIGPNVEVTINGESSNLEDLQPGQRIRVTMTQSDGKWAVSRVESVPAAGVQQ